jgi:hypothetical protein
MLRVSHSINGNLMASVCPDNVASSDMEGLGPASIEASWSFLPSFLSPSLPPSLPSHLLFHPPSLPLSLYFFFWGYLSLNSGLLTC